MQHLALLTRFLIIEEKNGPTDIQNADVMEYIDRYQSPDGIGNESFEEKDIAKNVLRVMSAFYDAFKEDPMVVGGTSGIKELRVEYFILSCYLLLRHLLKHYVWDAAERGLFRDFVVAFHERWSAAKEDDADIQLFSNKRQQTSAELETRHQLMRQAFFNFASEHGRTLVAKDTRRAFNEAERILIYRRDNGRCQKCLSDGKPDTECIVPWAEYDADHVIPHARGGETQILNARLLCRYHNQQKGARIGHRDAATQSELNRLAKPKALVPRKHRVT